MRRGGLGRKGVGHRQDGVLQRFGAGAEVLLEILRMPLGERIKEHLPAAQQKGMGDGGMALPAQPQAQVRRAARRYRA